MAKNLSKKTEQLVENVDEMSGVSFPNVDILIVEGTNLDETENEKFEVKWGDNDLMKVEKKEIKVFSITETEIQFLERLLHIQHSGGWGKHLDAVINERIKLLK